MDTTSIVTKLGIQLPIIQAPMAGRATTPELVASVSNTGGLGSLGAGYMAADAIRKSIREIRDLTNKPFAVNLFIPEKHAATALQMQKACDRIEQSCLELNTKINPISPPYTPSFEEQMNVVLEEKIPIFSFTFGIPAADYITKLKSNGTILIGTATNVIEACALENSGIDIVVAQGSEAGGHRGSFMIKAEDSLIGIMSLLPQTLARVSIPVVAAGGIMNAQSILANLILGAAGVQMGTAFLTCFESGIHPEYKKTLLNTTEDNTILSTAFSGKLARGIRNKFIDRFTAQKGNVLNYPIQNALTQGMRTEAAKQNSIDFMSMWAGQSAFLCKEISVSDLIAEITKELKVLLAGSEFKDDIF